MSSSYREYKKLKAKMKKLQKMKHDLQNPGQSLKHKMEPDAYKQAKHKYHQASNPGQTLKQKLQPDAYKKIKRRLKKLSKLKKMLKGEKHSKPRGGMMAPVGHDTPRHATVPDADDVGEGWGDSSSECSSVSSGSDLSDASDLSDLSDSDIGGGDEGEGGGGDVSSS